jgi:DNA-binding Xre family transcriptional regulator
MVRKIFTIIIQKKSEQQELTQSIGAAKAKLIFEYFTLKET